LTRQVIDRQKDGTSRRKTKEMIVLLLNGFGWFGSRTISSDSALRAANVSSALPRCLGIELIDKSQ
jgi:hypothetical protein